MENSELSNQNSEFSLIIVNYGELPWFSNQKSYILHGEFTILHSEMKNSNIFKDSPIGFLLWKAAYLLSFWRQRQRRKLKIKNKLTFDLRLDDFNRIDCGIGDIRSGWRVQFWITALNGACSRYHAPFDLAGKPKWPGRSVAVEIACDGQIAARTEIWVR